MARKKNTGIIRIIKATRYSIDGLAAAFKSEAAFRQELCLFAVGSIFAALLAVTHLERAMLVGSLFLVLIVEIINTAIETTINRISEDEHPLSKKAKDLGSAAVLLSLLNAFAVWTIILIN